MCDQEFETFSNRKNTCSVTCRALQRKATRNLWYKNNAKRIYERYKDYHIKHNAGRLRAERLIRKIGIEYKCEKCTSKYKVEIHHIDHNVNNNLLSNLAILCKNYHYKAHAYGIGFQGKAN